jgi:allantoate deiminase
MYGTPAFTKGCSLVADWFKQAGLDTRVDNIGNVRGRLNSKGATKTFVIASHVDTVTNAGMYDGPLGVIMGLDIVTQLAKSKSLLPFNIELVAFADEEGTRFHTTFLGSKVMAGTFDEALLGTKDANGITLKEAIQYIGGNPAGLKTDLLPKDEWLGYFEVHIEQGPVLYAANLPVAIVTAIAGQKRATLLFTGQAGHAGTVPMDMRSDAMCCAAECIVAIEQYARKHLYIIATVGKLDIINQASNVIPGEVLCSLDLRSADEEELDNAWNEVDMLVKEIAKRRNISVAINLIQETLPVKCDYHLNFLMKRAIVQAGYPVQELVSGAGHDAVPIAAVAPVAMLFVKCFKGISHNPLEAVDTTDIAAALHVSDLFFQNLINYYNQP